jgi:ABC-type Mn2+/Zn2+ transport system permease subunit
VTRLTPLREDCELYCLSSNLARTRRLEPGRRVSALGTRIAVGLMMLPAATGFWVRELWSLSAASSALASASTFLGLLVYYHLDLPSGRRPRARLGYLASLTLSLL